MIYVLATIHLAPGTRARFLDEFRALVPAVRAEAGCLEYGPAVDTPSGLAAQAPLREDAVVVIEKWADVPSLEAHLRAPHVAAYRERVKDLVRGMDLQVLAPA